LGAQGGPSSQRHFFSSPLLVADFLSSAVTNPRFPCLLLSVVLALGARTVALNADLAEMFLTLSFTTHLHLHLQKPDMQIEQQFTVLI